MEREKNGEKEKETEKLRSCIHWLTLQEAALNRAGPRQGQAQEFNPTGMMGVQVLSQTMLHPRCKVAGN